MAGLRIVQEIAGDQNLAGVHITPWCLTPNDRGYAKRSQLRLAVFTYVGMPGPLWPMEPNTPTHLDDVALAFPDLVIVAHNIGDPWTNIAVRLEARHTNFDICTSA